MALVPEIKLIRTDTTLDLSQKAEKVCLGLKTTPLYRLVTFAGQTVMSKIFYLSLSLSLCRVMVRILF